MDRDFGRRVFSCYLLVLARHRAMVQAIGHRTMHGQHRRILLLYIYNCVQAVVPLDIPDLQPL
jgi:hypothetical protein